MVWAARVGLVGKVGLDSKLGLGGKGGPKLFVIKRDADRPGWHQAFRYEKLGLAGGLSPALRYQKLGLAG